MLYNSTQNKNRTATSAEAISKGLSEDGGLFVPQEFPQLSNDELNSLIKKNYNERAKVVLGKFLTDFSEEEISECVDNAYTKEKFDNNNPAPITEINLNGNPVNILELWHGPTCAFKDLALQILPHLLTKSFNKIGNSKKAVILVATSGDTGKAALEGFKGVKNTRLIVFYPENGVSTIQKFQMDSQEGENLKVCAVEGNFDDAQTSVKRIFTSEEMNEKLEIQEMQFSSANSINWGRLVPQVVYYVSAYCDLVRNKKISIGDKINIVVPTGNFGNILAAYYAKSMGIPINKLICASNSNNVLTDFINSGLYNKNRDFFTTISPSMDILVSSNLERLLYHLSNNNDSAVSTMMSSLKKEGSFTIDEDLKRSIQNVISADYSTEEETTKTINSVYNSSQYLCDTHTAVAINVYEKYLMKTQDKTPALLVSTASPFKFPAAVLKSVVNAQSVFGTDDFEIIDMLSSVTNVKAPDPILNLKNKSRRFKYKISTDKMEQFILDSLGLA